MRGSIGDHRIRAHALENSITENMARSLRPYQLKYPLELFQDPCRKNHCCKILI